MGHLLNDFQKLLWCNFYFYLVIYWVQYVSSLWWYFQGFKNRYVLWLKMYNHVSQLNITSSMVMAISLYQTLTKVVFSTPEICRNTLNIFWDGIETIKFMYFKNRYTWSCVALLYMVVCACLCLLLEISDIGFTEDNSCGMWHISKRGAGICHYH